MNKYNLSVSNRFYYVYSKKKVERIVLNIPKLDLTN